MLILLHAVASSLCPRKLLPESALKAPKTAALALLCEGKLSFLYPLSENLLYLVSLPSRIKNYLETPMNVFFLLPFAGNLSYPYCVHSQYTTVFTFFWCPLQLQHVSALSGLLSPLGLYKECYLSLFYSWGCRKLSLLPKKLLCGLAHQSPSWGRGRQWIPCFSMTCHSSVPWASPWSPQGLRSLTSCGEWLTFLLGSLVTQSIGPTEPLSL